MALNPLNVAAQQPQQAPTPAAAPVAAQSAQAQEAPLSIAEIAGIDLNDVPEFRFETLPKIAGHWEGIECKFETLGNDNIPAIVLTSKCVAVEAVLDYAGKPEELVGKEHRQAWMVKGGQQGAENLGRFKAYCIDAMLNPASSKLPDVMAAWKGHRFAGKIQHRKDKNDPDRIYTSIGLAQKKPGA